MEKNKKILVVTTSFPRWQNDKVTSFIYHFAERVSKTFEVHVLAPHSIGAQKYEHMGGIKVYRFRYAPQRYEKFGSGTAIMDVLKTSPFSMLLIPLFVGAAALSIMRLYRAHNYDVIHVHWMIPFAPVVGLLRVFLKFRYVVTAHGSDVFPFTQKRGWVSRLVWLAHRIFTAPQVDAITTVSHALQKSILQALPALSGRVSVVSMGIDYPSFSRAAKKISSSQPAKIIFVGRLTEIKGVRYLIEAIRLLRDRDFNVKLEIYGDGVLRSELEAQVRRLHLENDVFFCGFIQHDLLPQCLAQSDIFVGPSITTSIGESEGFGLVFLEAMAAGLAVIGSNVGGIPDIITDKETGILVAEKDPESIANAISLLMTDKQLYANIVQKGKNFSQEYDWASIAEKYFKIYEGR